MFEEVTRDYRRIHGAPAGPGARHSAANKEVGIINLEQIGKKYPRLPKDGSNSNSDSAPNAYFPHPGATGTLAETGRGVRLYFCKRAFAGAIFC